MINRRNFATRAAGTLGVAAISPAALFTEQLNTTVYLSKRLDRELMELGDAAAPELMAENEKFWSQVRSAYRLNPDVVNLDHGWTNPTTRAALDELVRGARQLEALPAEELGRLFFGSSTGVRSAVAEVMGVPSVEIALVRNATEALNTVLLGLTLKAGDEIVCSAHDYFAMLDALEQRRARDGVVLRMIRPPIPAPSLETLAELYETAIGPRTRLVLVTHVSNLTGQLFPVQRIAAAAHRVGAEVVVDGAQSLGVQGDPVSALDCDYYGASAHKWLGTPVGLGVLWMRPAHVAKIWPIVPPPPDVTGMRRFEWIGTAPAYLEPAALPALALHRSLGAARKGARLRYLSSHLRKRVTVALPNARFYTTAEPAMSIGIITIELPGVHSDDVQKRLRERHQVLTQSMSGNKRAPEVRGLRITPNVYTTLAELDRLVASLKAG
ncbi:MAG TPA: aminotransferase class V-fold PLP-dependent enzyme [Blastocatellia bacterium]|nr:aminotransferase class V-fold PLP-dependent enzyme [Blastocatellia bacterium]